MRKFLIILTAICMVGAFSASAMALEWNWYASSRMETFWHDQDAGKATFNGGKHTKQSLSWNLNEISRIGAKVKGEGPVSGVIQIGAKDVNTIYLRMIWGIWNFGAGKLMVGQNYSPRQQFISGQTIFGDLGLLGIGTQYSSRHPQVALQFGNFSIAAVKPETPQLTNDKTGTKTAGETTPWLPKFEAAYGFSGDTWNLHATGGFQTYTIDRVTSLKNGKKNDIDVTSWSLGLDGGMNFGPAYLKASVSYGVNPGNAGWDVPGFLTEGAFATWDGDDSTNDIPSYMAALVGGFALSDSLRFESGVGFRSDDYSDNSGKFDHNDNALSAYIQAVITAAPGVYFLPEFDWFQFYDNNQGNDAGTMWALGGKWQIDF